MIKRFINWCVEDFPRRQLLISLSLLLILFLFGFVLIVLTSNRSSYIPAFESFKPNKQSVNSTASQSLGRKEAQNNLPIPKKNFDSE